MSEKCVALNRFGFGARPGENAGGDVRGWLIDQLDRYVPAAVYAGAAPAADPASVTTIARLTAYRDQLKELRMAIGAKPATSPAAVAPAPAAVTPPAAGAPVAAAEDPTEAFRKATYQQNRQEYAAAVNARALAAIQSPAPFAERLVHFWANHFAVSTEKMEVSVLAGPLEFEAIRPHLMGSFRDMLFAVERHPAMLLYLDQAVSVGPNSALSERAPAHRQQRRQLGLNENLAREIMELHTLGVRTGYTQADVTEFARALTGWTVPGFGRGPYAQLSKQGAPPSGFVFAPPLHEPGARTILGRQWPQQGEAQAAAVLDMLATHPATARHIATKLARHFGGDDPPARLVARLEVAFRKTGGDLPSLYRTLIASSECWVPRPVKFKSPWEWSVSALRVLGVDTLPPNAMASLMNQLGQPVWQPGSPAGWDDVAGAWAGPDAVMRRVEAAIRLAQRMRDPVDPRQRADQVFPGALSPATGQAIARAESPAQGMALMLVAPEFLRR